MKKILSILVIMCIISTMLAPVSLADNPIVQTNYTADPAPMVHDGVLYVYTSHDEDELVDGFFTMNEWRVYSTTDMVNWTDHGSPLSYKTFSWASGNAWAAQCIERNGKFYMYVTLSEAAHGGRRAIGVGVSDSPTGPFVDALGRPLISRSWDDIDPTVFIDDDGQAYMYWGNPALYYVKLNEDMISFDRSIGNNGIVAVDMTTEAFGTRVDGDERHQTLYEEGPWFYKRGDLYYMIYAAGGIPEYIAYSTAPTATGPWTYRGIIMPQQGGSFTNHPGIADYKGNSYFFYHNAALPGGGGFQRSVAVEKFTYNSDGTIPTINMTTEGAPQIENLNPYTRVEAETIAWSSGLKTEPKNEGGMNICKIDNDDYIKVKGVDFGDTGAGVFTANVLSSSKGGIIELRLDSVNGTLIGTLPVSYTEGNWKTEATNVSGATGVHDLYLVFKGGPTGDLFKVDYWKFDEKKAAQELVAINAETDKYELDADSTENTAKITVKAIYADGTSRDVTAEAVATADQEGIVEINNDTITAVAYGTTSITVSYGGKTDMVYVNVKDMASQLTVKNITVNTSNIVIGPGRTTSIMVTAEYIDGHTEDVTTDATYNNPNPEIAEIVNGIIIAKKVGTITITISYKGKMGDAVATDITIDVKPAPVGGGNIAWYRFDEENGATVLDSSGNVNDAVIIGGIADRVEGIFGNALQLRSASQQYIKAPVGIVSELDDFTIAIWINSSTVSTWARIFDFGDNQDNYMFLTERANTGEPRFAIKVNGSNEQMLNATGRTLSPDTWYHIAVTKSGNTARMYINGELVGTNNNMTFKPSDLGVTVNNYIGQSQWPDPLFDGKIDDFSIYDNALSVEEIKALTITGVSDIEVTTVTGEAPVLPDSVAVDYHDGTSGIATVIWPEIDPNSYASAGMFTVDGIIAGTALTVTADVTVMGQAKEDEYIVSTTFTPSSLAGNKLLTANVKVENINAPNDSVLAIVSLYDSNDRMINVSYISKAIVKGQIETLTAGFILPADVTGHCVKVFVWDGETIEKSEMQPLSNVVSLCAIE